MKAPARVLVADDEPSIRFVLRETLAELGCEVVEAEDGDAALEALASGALRRSRSSTSACPAPSGLELLDRVRALGIDTAVGDHHRAEHLRERRRGDEARRARLPGEAVRHARGEGAAGQGAAHARARARGRAAAPRGRAGVAAGASGWSGAARRMLEIFKTIGRVAARDVPVLITGESGTGKELVARAIHAASPRGAGPFVAVNCAAIPRELLESELFGHERGAFTGAIAARRAASARPRGGTLFLDEIGDMPLDLQAKLLRVLQDGEVTPVGGSATRDGRRAHRRRHAPRPRRRGAPTGRFREDLLYRLRVVPMHLPPLRERREDVARARRALRRALRGGAGRARRATWPTTALDAARAPRAGRATCASSRTRSSARWCSSSGEVLTPEDFAFLSEPPRRAAAAARRSSCARERRRRSTAGGDDLHRDLLERVERPLIEAALARTDGNQIRAAALLGINRNTLRKKIVDARRSRCRGASDRLGARAGAGCTCWPTTTRAGGAIRSSRRAPPARAAPRWCSCARSAPATARRSPGRARSAR